MRRPFSDEETWLYIILTEYFLCSWGKSKKQSADSATGKITLYNRDINENLLCFLFFERIKEKENDVLLMLRNIHPKRFLKTCLVNIT